MKRWFVAIAICKLSSVAAAQVESSTSVRVAVTADADEVEPIEHLDDDSSAGDASLTVMGLLGRSASPHASEDWNIYTQATTIGNYKAAFAAPYTNLDGSTRSLTPNGEGSYTQTATIFAGMRAWHGGEFYVVPEASGSIPLSDLYGLGASVQNGELQKAGSVYPKPYLARAFLRDTVELGGETIHRDSGPMQLAGTTTSRRLVFTVGNLAELDIFDRNAFAGDVRRQFMNMAFMTYTAYDMAADARGYTWGGAVELYLDAWAARFGRFAGPIEVNQLPLNFDLLHNYGDQLELEHRHELLGLAGAVRVLGFRNREWSGRFADAIAAHAANPDENALNCPGFSYGSQNASAPDLCWVRRSNVKVGLGASFEQSLGHGIGVFGRAMMNDGQTEIVSYLSADAGVAGGALATGELWHRPRDSAGIGYSAAFISDIHAKYLEQGGVDGFVGDGALHPASERALETFYSVAVSSFIWLTGDFQEIWNPGFNADRSHVTIIGGRLHVEL